MAQTALLVVDMFNTYRHPDADLLADEVTRIIDPLTSLVGNGRDRDDVDVIYVNDNYGDFSAQSGDIVRAALHGEHPELVRPITPEPHSRFVTKVRHSIFYSTALDYLLSRLQTERVILVGQVTEQCILYSALDAHLRHYAITVPHDAVAHIDDELGAAALTMMQRNMSADIVAAAKCLD